jgi:periplasmic protein TonB
MIAKKNPKLDIERKRFAFFQVGLITAGTMALVAFRWASPVEKEELAKNDLEFRKEIPFEFEEKTEPILPEPIPQLVEPPHVQLQTDEINEVDNTRDVTNPFHLPDILPPDFTIGNGNTISPFKPEDTEIFVTVEEDPSFPGGEQAMMEYLKKKVKYPAISVEMRDQGRVYVKFVVDTDGSISQAHVAKGVTPDLDAEALRVVRSMPKWNPGKQRGRAVKVWYTIPIYFRLQ